MLIKVKVKPRSNEEKVEKINNKEYIINLKESPENNKANNRLINLLAKEFKADARTIKIKNPKSRDKLIEIQEEGAKHKWKY